jgi:hypothetical protein
MRKSPFPERLQGETRGSPFGFGAANLVRGGWQRRAVCNHTPLTRSKAPRDLIQLYAEHQAFVIENGAAGSGPAGYL